MVLEKQLGICFSQLQALVLMQEQAEEFQIVSNA
jgi:hypothetical protein